LEGADDLGEFDGRRENLGLDEGETMTAPAVEDIARPTGAYFSECALQFMQILFSMSRSVVYNDATNNRNTINRLHSPFKQNTYSSLRTPGFSSVHKPVPDAAFAPGAATINPVGLRIAETRAEKFCLPIVVTFGAEMDEP